MALLQPPAFNVLLKRYRVAAGLTQEQLAELAGVSPRTISELERRENLKPHRDTVGRLAHALRLEGSIREQFEAMASGLAESAHAYGDASVTFVRRLGAPPATALIGREFEIAAIEEHIGRDWPPFLLLAGEPGIGKSRLLDEAARYCELRGMTVLWGGCQQRSAEEPYAPLLEALERYVAQQSPQRLRMALQGCSWLVRLLPEIRETLRQPLPGGSLDPVQERRLMLAAVIRFLRNIAGPAGLLLVLDDLQWAGTDACDLLATLVRTATNIPLRVIGAYRDTELEASHAFAAATANLGRAELVTVIPLRPLRREDAAVLLHELLSDRTDAEHLMEEQIIERTGGVPFFLVSCAEGIRAGVRDSEVPWSLAQSVRQRVAHCSANAQTVLRIAAVAGRSVSRSVLLSVTKMGAQGALAGLDEACSAGLLTPTANHTYRFFHDVIREVVEADLGPEQRTRLHALIGLALEEGAGPERAAVLAWHFSQGDQAERALQYSLVAGDHAVSVFANDEAEQHFRWATELAVVADPSRRAQIVEKYGLALRALARYDEALHWLEEAARLQHAAGNAEIEGLLIAHIGQVLGDLGRPREGIARIQQRIAFSSREDHSHPMAVLYVTLAGLFWSTGEYDQQLAAAERAAELARIREDGRVLLRAEVRRGQALRSLGRYEEAQHVLEKNIPAIEAASDLELLAPALDSLSIVYLAAGDFHREALHLRRGLEAARHVGDPSIVAFIASKLGQNAYYQGEWNRARKYLEEAVSIVRTLGAAWFAPYALGAFGGVFLATGDWKNAAEYLEESITISSDAAFQALENSQSLMAILEISQGRPEAALARLQRFIDGSRGRPSNLVGPRWVLAWSLLELGNDHAASAIVAPEIARARAQNDQLGLVHLLWIHALIAARQARWAEAEGALAEVLTITRRMPYPYHEARALGTYGSIQAQQGDRSAARQSLTEALAIFQHLGARPYIERIERHLAGDQIQNPV